MESVVTADRPAPEPLDVAALDYWRRQLESRSVPRDVTWPDTDVLDLVARLLATLDAERAARDGDRLREIADRLVEAILTGQVGWQVEDIAQEYRSAALAAPAPALDAELRFRAGKMRDVALRLVSRLRNQAGIECNEMTMVETEAEYLLPFLAAERAARDGAHKPDVTPLGTSCIECGEHWPCSAARDGGLREAVVEYLAADDDMPEFADAQRMDSAEWDRRNRRWAAADVALKDALASPAPALDARLAVAEAAFDWGGHECDHAGYCAGCAALHAAIDRHDRFSSGAAPREGEGQ